MKPKVITTTTLSNDDDGIAELQTIASATTMTLDGALVSGGIATMAEAQIITIDSVGNDSGITFAVAGTDADGATHTETVTGGNAGAVTTTAYFKTVISITTSGATADDVKVGPLAANGMVTKSIPVNWRQSPFNMSLSAEELLDGGTASAQYTVDDPTASYTNSYSDDANWQNVVGLTTVTTSDDSNIAFPVRAVRGILTVGDADSTWKFTFIQGQNS